jgi:hypothetical protein
LLVIGAGSAGWYAWTTFETHQLQDEARQALEIVSTPAATDSRVLGQIDIPSIRLSAARREH